MHSGSVWGAVRLQRQLCAFTVVLCILGCVVIRGTVWAGWGMSTSLNNEGGRDSGWAVGCAQQHMQHVGERKIVS